MFWVVSRRFGVIFGRFGLVWGVSTDPYFSGFSILIFATVSGRYQNKKKATETSEKTRTRKISCPRAKNKKVLVSDYPNVCPKTPPTQTVFLQFYH